MKKILFAVAGLILPFFSKAQSPILNESPFVTNERLSIDSQRPLISIAGNTLPEVLDHVFDSLTSASSIKGFNAAMYFPDGTIWKRASGLASELPELSPLTTEHLMGMGSITKSFVSVTLLLMYEEGLLDLDDSIGQYLDPYPNVPGQTTIRQLLSHRSGISDYLNENPAMIQDWVSYPDSIWIADTLLHHYVLKPNFPVGTDWSYSNTNYLLAGRIIERITGRSWLEEVRIRILTPYELAHTFAYPWELPGSQPFSHVWIDIDGDGTVDDLQGYGFPDIGLFSLASSAGCYLSTPEDLVRFSQLVYGGEVLQDSTLLEMVTDYVLDASNFEYGLGTAMYSVGVPLENHGHDGSLFYKSFALHFPSEEMSLAVQQNDDRTWVLGPDGEPFDLFFLFIDLMNTYLNYKETSAISKIESTFENITIAPNPTNDLAQIRFQLKQNSDIQLQIHQLDGRLVNSSAIGFMEAGQHQLNLPLEELQNGMYVIRLQDKSQSIQRVIAIQ